MDVGLADIPLAGRARELGFVREVVDGALKGAAAGIVLCGEPGIGKTRLVEELTTDLPADVLVLRGYGLDLPGLPELRAPFGLLVDALRWVPADLPEPLRDDVAAWIDPPATTDIEPIHLRHAHLLRLMEELTQRHPVVLVLEDLHWSDDSSLGALALLVRRLSRQRLAVVATTRPPTGRSPVHRDLLGWLRRQPQVRWLEMSRLTEDAIAVIVDGLAHPSREDLTEAIALAEGNPLAAIQVGTALVRGTDLGSRGVITDIVASAWSTAPIPAQHLLWAAALVGRRVEFAPLVCVVQTLHGYPDDAVDEAVTEAVNTGLASMFGEHLVFRHELERRWLVESVPPVLRHRMHIAIAETLRASGGAASGAGRLAEIARHWSAAGAHAEAANACLDAALAAEGPQASPEVLDQVEVAVREMGELDHLPVELARRLPGAVHAAADAARWAGQGARGAKLLRSFIDQLDPDTATFAWERVGRLEREAGDRAAAADAYDRALHGTGSVWARTRALAGAAAFQLTGPEPDNAGALCAEGLAIGGPDPTAERAGLLCSRGVLRALQGDIDGGLADLEESGRIADAVGANDEYWRYLSNATYVLWSAGRHDESMNLALAGVQRARPAGIVGSGTVMPLASNTASGLLSLGRWDEALEIAAVINESNADLGEIGYLALLVETEIHIYRGDFDTAAETLRTLDELRALTRSEDLANHIDRLRAELRYWNAQGESTDSYRSKATALQSWKAGTAVLPVLALAARVIADGGLGSRRSRSEAATRLARRLAEAWAALPEAPLDDRVARAMAIAELSRVDADDPIGPWLEALNDVRELRDPFNEAYCQFRLAEAVAPGDRNRASAELASARSAAEKLGARPLLDAIDAFARRTRLVTGTARPTKPTSSFGLDSLTDRERAILSQLAEGLSNRQIARRLAISERTVGVHVSHILAKLGVTTRVEAAAVLHRSTRGVRADYSP